jgi:glycosyltransferase involved in cell wall biosynthesis
MPALDQPLRIAQVAPLHESVPPRLYGGTERVVSYLTEELVRQGHRVTLFASGDSSTSAELVPGCDRALRLDPRRPAIGALHTVMIEEVFKRSRSFDIIHCHTDSLHFSLARRSQIPVVTTLHGRLDLVGLPALHREFAELPLVSISDAQRAPLPWASWTATVHHGLPTDLHVPSYAPGSYLAFLGRISPEKGVDQAIAIAQRSKVPLMIAAKVDEADREYFATYIKPLVHRPLVHFVGEIDESEKTAFLSGALALIFPIDWPEPFGLAMIEALACGTPVIAFRRGAVPEIIDHGVTGYIVTSVEEAVEHVPRARHLDRHRCRQVFEQRFSATRMAQAYCEVYARVRSRHVS